MSTLIPFEKPAVGSNEAEIESHAKRLLEKNGYRITMRRCDSAALNKRWPSKAGVKAARAAKGYPALLLYAGPNKDVLVCVWENKPPSDSSDVALEEAKFYVDGLRKALPAHPGLPRFAVGYNGKHLRLAFLDNQSV